MIEIDHSQHTCVWSVVLRRCVAKETKIEPFENPDLVDFEFHVPALSEAQVELFSKFRVRMAAHGLTARLTFTQLEVVSMTLYAASGSGGFQYDQAMRAQVDDWGADDFAAFESACVEMLGT